MRAAYDGIYFDLKQAIMDGEYRYRDFLPSEAILVKRYRCAHNTVRKALGILAQDGFVQPIHGKGVRVIYRPLSLPKGTYSSFQLASISSFFEAGHHHGFMASTKVLSMEPMEADEGFAQETGFLQGERLMHFERVRLLDGRPLIRETNFFRADIVKGITREDAEHSIYQYIEKNDLGRIVTSKRIVSIEPADESDREHLDLQGANYLANTQVHTFDGDGLLCEASLVRHHPEAFALAHTAIRTTINRSERRFGFE